MPNLVEVNYKQTGKSKSTNAFGMRDMQEKAEIIHYIYDYKSEYIEKIGDNIFEKL
jgi:hypothetical protein